MPARIRPATPPPPPAEATPEVPAATTDASEAPAPDVPDPAAAPALRWPDIDVRQAQRLTDDTGMFQHALYATPDPNHGYCIDDNARALIAALRYARLRGHDESVLSLHRYLMFVTYAFNHDADTYPANAEHGDPGTHLHGGRFRNFMGYDRRWLEDVGSDDSQGRALWALGLTAAEAPTPNLRDLAREVYERALPGVVGDDGVAHIRSWAFALHGVAAFASATSDHGPSNDALASLADRLHDALRRHRADGWPWWEDLVTYDNAKLPHALLTAGRALGRDDALRDGFEALRWLLEQQTERNDDGTFRLSVIGNDGWLPRGGKRAAFDQQPLEAYALVDACLDAARLADAHDGDAGFWEQQAWLCFTWFLGNNDSRRVLVDPRTGGCCDGLHADGVNRNQGAESSLAYLLSVLELHRYEAERPGRLSALADAWPQH